MLFRLLHPSWMLRSPYCGCVNPIRTVYTVQLLRNFRLWAFTCEGVQVVRSMPMPIGATPMNQESIYSDKNLLECVG